MTPKDSHARLTSEEVALIGTHLRAQYRDVFDDKMISAHISEFVEAGFASRLAEVIAASSKPHDTLLDIGAGYGGFVLSCRCQGLDASGIELAAFEVDISKKRLARIEPDTDPSTVFRNGDALHLPFPNDLFNTVTLLNVLEHVPDYRAALTEAVRILRPGGRLFVICPNYGAFRLEAHYHVPWLPYFPRRLASAYLRLLGRNPEFFQTQIHYCTNWGILRAFRRLNLQITSLDTLRLDHIELFSPRARRILDVVQSLGLLSLLKLAFRVNFRNPFKAAVTVIGTKTARS
jgi:MPBQ/MSBQ methyltransferase